MKIFKKVISFNTKGNCDIVNITPEVSKFLTESEISDGIVSIFVPGATAALTTIEYEEGLVEDTKKMFRQVVPDIADYRHDANHAAGNAPSHLRASLVGPSLVVQVDGGELSLGTWQQIVFIDFDNRPRNRKVLLKFIGE